MPPRWTGTWLDVGVVLITRCDGATARSGGRSHHDERRGQQAPADGHGLLDEKR
eukprot:gene43915-1328_t